MNSSPFFRYRYPARFVRLMVELVLFGLSSALNLRSLLGNSPWNAFHEGISIMTGVSIGRVAQLVGALIIFIDIVFKEPIGFGTIANMLVIGGTMDLILETGLLPESASLPVRILMLAGSIVCVAFGSWLYMSAGMGAGPRDSLMVGLAKRFPKLSVGTIRNAMELSVLVVGWLMGGLVGFGTVAFSLLAGPTMQWVFRTFHYDVRTTHAESFVDTFGVWSGRIDPARWSAGEETAE